MARWDHGYVTDVVYTNMVYREALPVWLATTALLLGHRPPDLTGPFRYADLGCGNGFTALTVAATSPQAEVWGFDFNPAHIENARGIAARAGQRNAHFVEASFAELAAMPPAALPEFDFIVAHGVVSWISAENRRQLIEVIRQRLRPGGLAYVSYNVGAGWGSMMPLRALMLMLMEDTASRSDQAAGEILDTLDSLKEAGALFFQANPLVVNRLAEMRQLDPRYLAHEYLNRDWHPLSFAEVEGEMAEAKCSYIGSATLTDNLDNTSVPAGMIPLLNAARSSALREMLRDFASNQTFRRDLYRRGVVGLPRGEHDAMVNQVMIAHTGVAVPDPITFNTPMGSVTGNAEVYQPLLARLQQGPASVGELRQIPIFLNRPVEALQAVALLMFGNYAHALLPGGNTDAARQAARALNRVTVEINGQGGDIGRLVAPLIGSVLPTDVVDTLLFGELLAGRPADAETLLREVPTILARSGRSLQRDGKPISDPVLVRETAAEIVTRFLERRLPALRALGVLDV